MPYNSQGMKRAWVTPDGKIGAGVFDEAPLFIPS